MLIASTPTTPVMRSSILESNGFEPQPNIPTTPPPPQLDANTVLSLQANPAGALRRKGKKKASSPTGAEVIHHYPPKITTSSSPQKGGKTVLIAYFPWEATKEDISNEFSKVCNVMKVQLVREKQSARPRCFGFVKFSTRENAERAIEATEQGMIMLNDSRGHVWHLKAEWAKSGDMVDDGDDVPRKRERIRAYARRHDSAAGGQVAGSDYTMTNHINGFSTDGVVPVDCLAYPVNHSAIHPGCTTYPATSDGMTHNGARTCQNAPNYQPPHGHASYCHPMAEAYNYLESNPKRNHGAYRCTNFCSPYAPVAPLHDASCAPNASQEAQYGSTAASCSISGFSSPQMTDSEDNPEANSFSWCHTLCPSQVNSFHRTYAGKSRPYAVLNEEPKHRNCTTPSQEPITSHSIPAARLPKFEDGSQTRPVSQVDMHLSNQSWQDARLGGYPNTSYAQPTCGNFGGNYGQFLIPNLQRPPYVDHFGAGLLQADACRPNTGSNVSQNGLGYGVGVMGGCRRYNAQHTQVPVTSMMPNQVMQSVSMNVHKSMAMLNGGATSYEVAENTNE